MSVKEGEESVDFRDRDVKLLRGLFDSRLMTVQHAAAIYFNDSAEAAKKRIQKLKAAGLVGKRARNARERTILFLTREGFTVLKRQGRLQDLPRLTWKNLKRRFQVSPLTVRHELEVMDIKASICHAIAGMPTFTVSEFSTWPVLFQFYGRRGTSPQILVKPDGFIRIRQNSLERTFEHTFFLEVDRSTETIDTLARRALCYLDFYRRGGLAERLSHPRSDYRSHPFRVLMVFKTAERRNNIAQRLLIQQPPILSLAWLTTLNEVLDDPFRPIWVRPLDYRNTIHGTVYDIGMRGVPGQYLRNVERDNFIESTIKKSQLITPADPPESRNTGHSSTTAESLL